MKLRHKKTFMRMLLSYFVVLCLSLSISILTYINAERIAKKEVEQYYSIMLEKNSNAVDYAVKNLNSIMFTISLDDTFKEIMTYRLPMSNQQRYTLARHKRFITSSQFDYLINSYFIVYPQIDMVCRGECISMEKFYNISLKNKWETFNDWRGFLAKPHNMEYVKTGDSVYCVNSVLQHRGGIPEAIIFLELNQSVFFNYDSVDDGLHFLIYDTNGDKLTPIIGLNEENEEKINISEALKSKVYNHGGEQYFVMSIDSTQNSWKYIYLISMTNFTKRMLGIRAWLILGIVVTCMAGIALIWVLTRRQYKPIENTVSMLYKKFGDDPKGRVEYEYIESTVRKISDEYLQQNSVTRENGIKELALLKLLRGESCNEELKQIAKKSLQNKYYMVIIFSVDDAGKLFFEENERNDNVDLAYIIIENVYKDILGDGFTVEKCRANELILIIGTDDEHADDDIYRLVGEGQNIIEQKFNILFAAMMSRLSEGRDSIPRGYSEALECTTHRFFSDNSILRYEDIKKTDFGVGYYYPLDQERSLMNYLKLADYNKAQSLIYKMIDFNLGQGEVSPVTLKCMIYDVCGTVVKTISEIGEDGNVFFEKLSILENIEKCNTVNKMRELISNLIMECCKLVEMSGEKSSNKVVKQIKAYVLENYQDTELTVAGIADKFEMNANYLSALFKQKTGTVLWEYVTSIRIEKAQEIFRSERLKVEEAAIKCGYENVRTFSRMFKKHTGVTPGQFRGKI